MIVSICSGLETGNKRWRCFSLPSIIASNVYVSIVYTVHMHYPVRYWPPVAAARRGFN